MSDKSSAWEPQFRVDGQTWLKMVLETDDPEARLGGYASAADLLLGEIIRYGTFNDGAMIRDLQGLYDEFVRRGLAGPLRREVYRQVAGFQQNTSFVSANAYLPFIACEPERGICSTAVIDYVSIAPAKNPFENAYGWAMRLTRSAPMATWIMASETSRSRS